MGAARLLLFLLLAAGCRLHFDDLAAHDGGGDGPDGAPLVAPRVLAASDTGVCAVLDDTSLWCWGDNAGKALGVTTLDIIPPTQIGTGWSTVATSIAHSCGIKTDGTLWCWGQGTNGALGDGGTSDVVLPEQIGTATDWTEVTVNQYGGCGLRSGALYCWGLNAFGSIGDGTTTSRAVPTAIMAGTTFQTVATQGSHVCAIDATGALYCWGLGAYGELGNGSTTQTNSTPLHIGTATWRHVIAGNETTCGIQTNNSLWCWGLYIGSTPVQIGSATDWSTVSVGDDFNDQSVNICGLRGTDLWCAGGNVKGALGTGNESSVPLSAPVQVDAGHAFTLVAGATDLTCVARDNALACTGVGARGQLGDGVARFSKLPKPVAETWTHVATGYQFVAAIASDGSLQGWGANTDEQLSANTYHGNLTPKPMTTMTGWTQVTGEDEGALAVRSDMTLWRFGAQFNAPGSASIYNPAAQLGTSAAWTAIAGGGFHDCGVQSDGSLWCWGANTGGELGNGSSTSSATPVKISAMNESYTSVGAGFESSCAVKAPGSLWCWGLLANNAQSPTQIGAATTWKSVAVGYERACALQSDASLWCWGTEPGDGTPQANAPVHIGTATWTSVSAGATHSCGIRSDGSLWCWGDNDSGQLGDGTRTAQLVPMRVGSGTSWIEVRAAWSFTCALDNAGTVSCWGDNTGGQLGDGTAWVTSFVPVVR